MDRVKTKFDSQTSYIRLSSTLQIMTPESARCQQRLQIEDLQRRLDSAESRLARCGEQPGQIAVYLEKAS